MITLRIYEFNCPVYFGQCFNWGLFAQRVKPKQFKTWEHEWCFENIFTQSRWNYAPRVNIGKDFLSKTSNDGFYSQNDSQLTSEIKGLDYGWVV